MEDQDVGALLVRDIEAHMTYLQLGGFFVTIVLALIGVVLSMRAYAVLSEARALYWQASTLGAAEGAWGAAIDRKSTADRARPGTRATLDAGGTS